MNNAFALCWRYLRAFALIYLCLFAGNTISALLPIAIPGSIIGMLLLFALLASQILPAKWVKPGCHVFIRYMVLLFVPIGVGVMQYYQQIVDHLAPLLVSCAVSTLIVLLVVAYSSHYFHRERSLTSEDNDTQEDK